MPRIGRIASKTGVYHAMIRGINRQDIFLDKEDRVMFLEKLGVVKQRSNCDVYAYCLMSNHVHLLIAEKSETIGQIMKRLGSAYVYWYNQKYGRVGHLFQGRFHSEPVDDEAYLLVALRYIHQNPIKAGITANCESYPWSSYHDYLGAKKSSTPITDTELVLHTIGGQVQFVEFHLELCDVDLLDIDDVERATDELAQKLIQQVLASRTPAELMKMPRVERKAVLQELKSLPGVSHRQIERITGINRNIIQRA